VGKGTTFTLFIPICKTAPLRSLTRTQKLRVRRHAGLALVVEDQPAIRKYMSRIVNETGMELHVAQSSEDALALLESLNRPLDLLVSDVMLPGKSGRELAEELRQRFPELRVILTSGYVGAEAGPESLFEKKTAFLAKPFTAKELCREIDQLMNPPRQLTGKILVVEPGQESSSEACELLDNVGNEIILMKSGREALDYLRSSGEAPSLMLLDARLSDVSAQEIVETIRKSSSAAELPVILLESAGHAQLGAPGPNTGVVRKPLTSQKLASALAEVGLQLS
jgi:CheY-like chemotaxis protein